MQLPDIFRGFIPLGEAKTPVSKYTGKDAKVFPLREVERGNFAGLLQDGWCFIDVDDGDDAELLYKIIMEHAYGCHIQKTTRGYHFYYRNPGIRTNKSKNLTALGIMVELKVNINQLVPITVDGKFREWPQIAEPDEVEDLPIWLRHCSAAEEFNFPKMRNHDGRQDSFFRYKGKLLRAGFDSASIVETLTIINKYVIKDPLSRKEFDHAIRETEEAKKKTFFLQKRFQHAIFGDYLLNNYKFGAIEGQLHVQGKDYLYSAEERDMERIMVSVLPDITEAQRKETLKYILIRCDKDLRMSDPELIPLRDKVYNLHTGEMLDYNSRFVFRNKIPHMPVDYNKDVDNTLNKLCCHDPKLRLLIEEMLGYGMWRRNELRKSFMLLGDRRSGKSTFLTILKRLYGEDNYTTLSLQDLEDKFRPSELGGKLINVGDDISSKYIENDSMFKVMVSGETAMVEQKYGKPYKFRSTVKFYFAMNKLAQVNDKGSGFIDRVIVFPFEGVFDKSQPDFDPYIIDKLTSPDALGYVLKVALDGLKRVVDNNGFTATDKTQAAVEEYDDINNPHRDFIRDTKIEYEPISKIQEKYSSWCTTNRYKAMNARNFNEEVKRMLGLKPGSHRLDGETKWCYIPIAPK